MTGGREKLLRHVHGFKKGKWSYDEGVPTTQNAKTGGRSREVVVYNNQTTEGVFHEELQAHLLTVLLYGRYFIACNV